MKSTTLTTLRLLCISEPYLFVHWTLKVKLWCYSGEELLFFQVSRWKWALGEYNEGKNKTKKEGEQQVSQNVVEICTLFSYKCFFKYVPFKKRKRKRSVMWRKTKWATLLQNASTKGKNKYIHLSLSFATTRKTYNKKRTQLLFAEATEKASGSASF